MPKEKFTKTKIDSLKFTQKGQVIYWDTETKGLGLVVGTNTKTFRLQLDIKDATRKGGYRTVKKTLGRYGDITLEQAKSMLNGYVDQDGQAVPGERVQLRIDALSSTANKKIGFDKTLGELIAEYYAVTKRRDGRQRKPSTAVDCTKLVVRHYESWIDLLLPAVAIITPDAVLKKYADNENIFGKHTARNSASTLSGILKYGLATYPKALPLNPLAILSNPHVKVMAARQARHECLTYDADKKRNDFPVFLQGLQNCTEAVRDGFLFCLYTGMRREEVEELRWTDIDLKHSELFLDDTKNRTALHIPLNSQAMSILWKRQSTAQSVYIFTQPKPRANNKSGHILLPPSDLKKQTGLDITTHGLRRTFTTIGRRLKRFEDARKLTNHIDSSVEGKHYDETGVEDLRETSQMIGDTIDRYMKESGAVVIQFPGMAKAA